MLRNAEFKQPDCRLSQEGQETSFPITPATKIRTNPYSRFGPATADRGSRGIRDQPRNPPKCTEKRIRIDFPFPRRGHTLCRSRRTAASARRPGRSAGESGGTSEPAGSSSRTCKCELDRLTLSRCDV